MNVLFIILLVLNLLVEALAAATLIGGPGGLAAAGSGNQWSMHYGFAALAIASASLWVWPRRHDPAAVTPVLGLLMVFHSGLFVSLAVAGDQMGGMVIHAVLAAMAIGLFVSRAKLRAG
ncbi:MAG: hypothetical protein RIB46_08685 [Pseudomonadales bacterium]